MEDSRHIGAISLFADLSEEERHHLATWMQKRDYRRGEIIFEARNPAGALYIIEAGSVALLRRVATGTTELATLGVGELLGGKALLLGRPHSVTAQAVTDITTRFLSETDLEALLWEHPSIGLKLSLALGARIVYLDRYLMEERLRGIGPLAALSEQALAGIAARLGLETYGEGSFVYQAGEAPHSLYIMEDGEVRVTTVVGGEAGSYVDLGGGSIFGQEALLTGKPHMETAQAETEVTLWALGREDLEELLARFPSLEEALGKPLPVAKPDLTKKTQTFLRDLSGDPLFAELSSVEMDDVTERLHLANFNAGDLVCVEGKPCHAMYFIEAGQAEATTLEAQLEEMPPTLLGAGDFFGGMALLTGNPCAVTVRAVTDLQAWSLSKGDFDDLIVKYPLLALSFGRTLGEHLGETLAEERPTESAIAPQPEETPPMPVSRAPRRVPYLRRSLGDLKETFGEASQWFGRQNRQIKAFLILVVVLLLWILAVSLPTLVASALSRDGRGGDAVSPTLGAMSTLTAISRQGGAQPTAAVSMPAVLGGASPVVSRSPAPTLQLSPYPEPLAVVKVGTLNLRSGPGTGYVTLGLLYEGDEVEILGQLSTTEWLKVATKDGLEGWVYAAFVEANVPAAIIPTVTLSGY